MPPVSTIDWTVRLMLPAKTWSPSSMVRAVTATAAPSDANRLAIASPMPRLAPVTIATLPSSANSMPFRWVPLF